MKSKTYDAGMMVRRKVLGDAYVDRALSRADDFSAPLQDCLTEHAWGAVWTREEIPGPLSSALSLPGGPR